MALTEVHREARRKFKDAFSASGGSIAETARILGITERGAHQTRRNIEEDEGILLKSSSPTSPDTHLIDVEFPEWQQLEVKNGLLICFSDSHLVPGHKSTAHRALLKLTHELQPEAIADLGDLMDFSALGRFHRLGWDSRVTVQKEIEWAQDCLEELVKAGPKRMRRKRTRGNHDQRYSGFLANRVPEMEGVRGVKLEDHLPGWPVSWAINVNDNECCLTHRWKGGTHGPFNNTLWSGISYVTGHQHKQQCYPLTDLRGDRWGVDCGTLASIWGPHFRYNEGKPRNWRSGFAVLRFTNHKLRHPEFLRVVDENRGIVEFRGRDIQV